MIIEDDNFFQHNQIFFILSINKIDKNLKIECSDKIKFIGKRILNKKKDSNRTKFYSQRQDFIDVMYIYSIPPIIKKKEVEFKCKDSSYNCSSTIKYEIDDKRNNYLFDVSFKDGMFYGKAFKQNKMSILEQYKLFLTDIQKNSNVNLQSQLISFLLIDLFKTLKNNEIDLELYLTLVKDLHKDINIYYILDNFSIDLIVNKSYKQIPKDLIKDIIEIIKKEILTEEFFQKYNKDDNNRVILEQKTFAFCIFIIGCFSNEENLENILENIKLEEGYIQILTNNFLKDKKFSNNLINKLLPFCGSSEELIDVLKKTKTINDLLIVIINNEKIISKFEEDINIDELYEPRKEDSVHLIIKHFIKIEKMKEHNEKMKVVTIDVDNFFYKYIKFYKQQNLELLLILQLIILQDELKENNSELNNKFDNVLERLKNSIHSTGLSLIRDGKLHNNEVLDFILNDSIYSQDNKYDRIYIYKGIDLETIDNDFIEKYQKIEFYNIFEEYEYKRFLTELFKTIKTFTKFSVLLKLHPLDKDFNLKDVVIECMDKRFNELLLSTEQIESVENLKKIIIFFLGVYIDDNHKSYQIIDSLKKHLPNDILYDIFVSILDVIFEPYSRTNIIDFLLYKSKQKQNLYELIKAINQNEVLIEIFNKINECCLTELDIYSESKTKKFILLIQLMSDKYFFNDQFKDLRGTSYFKKTYQILDSFGQKIEKLNINESELSQLMQIEKEDLLERLIYIFYLNKEKANDNLTKLVNSYETITTLRKNMNAMLKYEAFFDSKGEKLESLKIFNNDLNNLLICDLEKNEEVINYVNSNIKDAIFYNALIPSKFFSSIFENLNYESPNNVNENREKTKEIYLSLDKMLDPNTINQIPKKILNIIFEEVKDIESFHKEIEFLKQYFNQQNVNTESIEDNLLIISKRDSINLILKSILFTLESFKIPSTEYTNKINEILNLLKKDILDNVTIKQKCDEIGYNCKDNYNYLTIIEIINEKPKLLPFIMTKKEEEIRNLIEFIDEVDGASIEPKDVQDLTKVIVFINDLQAAAPNKNDKTFIEYFKTIGEDKIKYNNIEVYFKNVSTHFSELSDLYLKTVNKDEFSKKKIESLYTSSIFEIYIKEGHINCNIKYDNKEIPLEEVLELRDRIMLKKNEQNSKDARDFLINSLKFSKILNQIEVIIDYMDNLNQKGYPNDIQITISIVNNEVEVKQGNDIKTLEQINTELKDKFDNLIDIQNKAYEDNQLITFLNGKQFYYMNKYIKDKEGNIDNILRYIFSRNNIKKKEDFQYEFQFEGNENEDMINNIISYFEELLEINEITIEDIYSQSLIQKDNYQGIYTILTPIESLEEDIIKWYHYLTNNLPIAQTILFCNESTTSEELIAFLYRALHCDSNTLFSLVKIELLDLEKRHLILEIINMFFIQKKLLMNSALIIYFTDRNSDIFDQLVKMNYHKHLDNGIIKEKYQIEQQNIQVVSAEASGLGKSNYIKESAKKNKLNYVFFPIGGDFTRQDIILRLLDLGFFQNDTLLHIDLLDTNKKDLMRDFLFNILILKYYSYQEKIYYLGSEVKIKIEVPIGFTNFMTLFPILSLFDKNKYVIKTEEIPSLLVSQDIISNIQIVCCHLQYYTQNLINKTNLFFPGYSYDKEVDGHYDNMKSLSSEQCINLIKQYFTLKNPTYYQITSFINILADQFKKFNRNFYLTVQQLANIAEGKGQSNLKQIRSFLVSSLIDITKHFTKGAYSELLNSQKITFDAQNKDIEEQATEALINKEKVSFDQIKPSLIFFNEDGQSLSIISTCENNTEEYRQLTNLYNSGEVYNRKDLIKYKKLTQDEFLLEIKKVLSIENELDKRKKYKNVELRSLKEISDSYVFTADNYIKMILILLRVRANIPVIMMGETGCGKTSLIRMIKELKNNDMITLNIHAGIADLDIINFIKDNHFLEKQKDDFNKKYKDKVWIFLDEINTCNSMGLISEMMCNHTMQGKKISNQVVFIAACNPYRLVNKRGIEVGLTKKKEAKVTNLVYSVHPLPFSLLNYVFDFGNLTKEDEARYIERMVIPPIETYFGNNRIQDYHEIVKLAANSVIKAQNYVRDLNDISSVSLREVRRFVILVEWFIQYLNKKKEINDKISRRNHINLTKKELIKRSIVLSIILCYYLRLPDKSQRQKFIEELTPLLGNIKEVADQEMNELADRVSLPPGIAKNRALLENLFTLFVCINIQIPVFICGKPGCSKSLSVQLIFKSMKGESSDNPFFRKFPKLYMNSYQGSLTSTSKGILKVFDKARNIVRNANKDEVISMFYFDEMGLAEISKNNPLKVIHSQLEYDDNKDKIAFVGISNWTLDASKMNRGIFISILDQDEEDLINTSHTIADSYQDRISSIYSNLLDALAKSYYNYKKDLSERHPENKEFHGSRDFYHLIKYASKEIIKQEQFEQRQLVNIGISSLERNFGGLSFSVKEIKQIFNKFFENNKIVDNYEVMNCIKENIQDVQSRYLLVISKASLSPYLLSSILTTLKKDYTFYLGSQFTDDQTQELYSVKILNKIQSSMEQEKVLVLKNLESIYPSLYDLFNQNFTIVGNKNYARIALGSSNNLMSYVNDKFRCVILLDQSEIDKQDPPFLNRFEKHIISFEYLLPKEYLDLSKEINDILKELVQPQNDKLKIKIDLSKELLNCDLEEIQGIVYDCRQKEIPINRISIEVFKKIIPTFSQDIIAFTNISMLQVKHRDLNRLIIDIYKNVSNTSISDFLKNTDSMKNVIYTFSSILETLILKDEIKTEHLDVISKESIKEILIYSIGSESELEKEFNEFYSRPNQKVCILRFRPCDCIHLNHIQYFIDNLEKEKKEQKMFIFLIHIQRFIYSKKLSKEEIEEMTIKNEHLISHLSTYNQLFIDNINGDDLKLTSLLDCSNEQILNNKEFIDYKEVIDSNIYTSFMKIKYIFKNKKKNFDIEQYIKIITEALFQNEQLKENIKNCITKATQADENYIDTCFYSDLSSFEKDGIDFREILKKYMTNIIEMFLSKFIFISEKEGVLYPILFSPMKEHCKVIEIWNDYLQSVNLSQEEITDKPQGNEFEHIIDLNIPYSVMNWKNVIKYINEIKDEYLQVENELRYNNSVEEARIQKKTYDEVIPQKEKNVLFEIEKQKQFNLIFSLPEGEEKNILMKDILHDYLIIYLSKKHNTELDELIRFLELLLELKFENEFQYTKQEIARYVLWLECYSDQIDKLFNIYNDLSIYNPNLFEEISERINEIEFEISPRNPKIKEVVNKAFYLIVESLLLSIFLSDNLFDFNDVEKIANFMKTITNIQQYTLQIESHLKLYSKELYSLQNFINCYKLIMRKGEQANELVNEFLLLFKKESEDKLKKVKEMEKDFEKQFEFCENNLKEFDEYPETMISVLITKYKQNSDKNFRKKIFEIVLSNNNFIIKSKELLFLYFLSLGLTPDQSNEDEIEEELLDNFMSFAQEEENEILSILNEANNPILNEIILFCFETSILPFFEEEKENKNEEYLKGITLKYFQKACSLLKDLYYNSLDESYLYPNLVLLYSIAYIKIYLHYYVEYNREDNNQMNFKDINDIIAADHNSTGKTIQLYTLKLFRNYFPSYEEFKKYPWNIHQMEWVDNFDLEGKGKKNSIFDFLLISLKEKDTFNKMNLIFDGMLLDNFKKDNKDFNNLLKEKDKSVFIDVIINKILAKFYNNDYCDTPQFEYFSKSFLHPLLNNYNIFSQSTKELLSLLNTKETVIEKLFNNQQLSLAQLEIILYSFKIVFNCSEANDNSFYKQFFSNNIIQVIKDNFIPGVEPNDDIRISSYYNIERYLNKYNNYQYGAYLCPCGMNYEVAPCGYPMEISTCTRCGQQIGGTNHNMINKPGHIRIVKDVNIKKSIESSGHYTNCVVLADFKKDIDQLNALEVKGIKQIENIFFIEPKEKVRGLDAISYRLLSFVIYSVLYYAKSLGYLNEDTIKSYLCPNTTCFEMLEKNWEKLKNLLKDKQINNIQIFMNIVFDKLFEVIKTCPMLSTKELRKEFEDKVNILVNDIIQNYQQTYNEYLDENNKTLQLDIFSLKTIIHELFDPLSYPHKEYPYLKYFMLTTYPSQKQIQSELESKEDAIIKYPVLVNYFIQKEDISKLQNLALINPFSNLMINKHSYKISREEAKTIKIEDELKEMKNEKEKQLYEDFETGWNKVCDKATKYQCRPEMLPKPINKEDYITYCLNDDGELGYGMYLASMYDNFITYQNTFLRSVIDNLKGNLITKESIMKEIYVQDATKSEIVSFDINVDRCLFSNFDEMLSVYSERSCFNNDNTINYSKYKTITYDYSKINEELQKLFIPGTKLFKTEQKFVIYKYEFLNGSKSSILQDFAAKYVQRNLSAKEKEILYNYKNNVKEYTDFLFGLQMIIFYLKKENFTNQVTICEVILSLPKYISLNKECKSFFALNRLFAIETLLGIYEYFEYLCFKDIKENVDGNYKKKIDQEGIDRINDYFNRKDQNRLITRPILSSGVRKFISRYLSGLRSDSTVKADENIFYSLPYKPDLWSKEIFDNPKFLDEFEEITELDIKVNQAIELCEVLGDDRELFGESLVINKNKENKEDQRINANKKPNDNLKKNKKKRQLF